MSKNYKLIRWADGTHCVRKGFLYHQYLDEGSEVWWREWKNIYRYCHLSRAHAQWQLSQLQAPKPPIDKGVVVK